MVADRRLPPQGGLPPLEAVGGAVVEIACDESGFSGSNLLDAATPVFTHASVDLSADEALELIRPLRSGSPQSLSEFKSGPFLRGPRATEALERLLTALNGRAHVQVIDKEFYVVTRIVDLFLAEPSYAAGTRLAQDHRPAVLTLYRAGRAQGASWSVFLAAFVELVRTKRHRPDRGAVERFFRARDVLAAGGLGAEAEEVLRGLSRARVRAIADRLANDDRSIPPPLEPMLPALAETVLFWSAGQRRVLVIHDEQSALTADRLRRLQHVLTGGAGLSAADADGDGPWWLPSNVSALAGLVTVDSRDDPRVQVADLLAGFAARSPSIADDGRLRPFLSPTSLRDPERQPYRWWVRVQPLRPAERPKGMRSHGLCARGVILLVVGCAAIATAGCGAGYPAQGPTPQQRADADAAAILRAFVAPPGATRLQQAPHALREPITTLVSTTAVDKVSFWQAPGQPQAVLAWEQAHLPRRFSPGDADFGPPSWDRMFSLPPVPGVLTVRDMVVEVTGAGAGQTAIRVDAEVSWQPPRSASERVPAAVRAVSISELPGVGRYATRAHRPVTITDPIVVRQLASLVDGLQLSTIGGEASCPGYLGGKLRLAFLEGRRGGQPVAVAQAPGECGTVQFTAGGTRQPALQLTGSFIGQVLKVAGLHWKVLP